MKGNLCLQGTSSSPLTLLSLIDFLAETTDFELKKKGPPTDALLQSKMSAKKISSSTLSDINKFPQSGTTQCPNWAPLKDTKHSNNNALK